MFPWRPEDSPEPDIVGTAGADRTRPVWQRYVVAGGVLALAGIVAVLTIPSPGHHTAASRRGGGTATAPAVPATASAVPATAPPVPGAVPTQAWAASLNIANWPMPGSGGGGPNGAMFAGGVAGSKGWELTMRNDARPGRRCRAAVMLYDGNAHLIAAYQISPHPALRTPAGDLAFIALGTQSPGVGIGFLQLGTATAQAWVEPDRIGGLEISVPILAMPACGERYYLAGFAYPLAGTLDVFVTRNGFSPVHYLVPARLSRPRLPRVWESTG